MKTALLIMALLSPAAARAGGGFDLPACSIPPICPAFRTGNILANGSVTATKFIGDCSQCTGGGGVSQIVAGTNITISPPGGTGAVTVNSTGGGGETAFFANSKTFGYGAPGSTITVNASVAGVAGLTVVNMGVNSLGASFQGSSGGVQAYGTAYGIAAYATGNGNSVDAVAAGNNVTAVLAEATGLHTSNVPLVDMNDGNTTRTGDFVRGNANANGAASFVGNLLDLQIAGISQFVITSSGGVQANTLALQDSNPLDSFIFKVSTPTSANYVLVSTFGYISLGSSGTLVTDGWDWTMKGGIAPLNALGSGNSTGGFLSFTAGKGLGQAAFGAAGGAISLTGGSGGSNDGPGGVVSIAAGASGPTNNGNANGGALNLSAGAGTSTGGSVSVAAGNGANSTGGSVNLSVGSGPSQPGSINLNGGGPGIQLSLRSDGHLLYNTGGGDPGEVTITGFGAAVPINPVTGDPEHYVLVVSTGDAGNGFGKWALSVATNGAVAVGAFDPISTHARLTVSGGGFAPNDPAVVVASGGQIKITGGSPGLGKVLTDATGTGVADWETPSGISGSGTSGYIPKWTGASSLGNTATPIFENSGMVGIGTSNPSSTFTVAGLIESTGGGYKFPDGTVQTTAIAVITSSAAGSILTSVINNPGVAAANSTRYQSIGGVGNSLISETTAQMPCPVAGSITSFYVINTSTDTKAGSTPSISFRLNGASVASISVPANTPVGTVSNAGVLSIQIAAGDKIDFAVTEGATISGTQWNATANFRAGITPSSSAGGDLSGVYPNPTVIKATPAFTAMSTVTVLGNAFSVGGSTLAVIGGNVGIGTTAPASKLHISSGSLIIDGNANPRIVITAPLGSGTTVLDATGGIIIASTFNVVGSDYEVDGKTVIDHDGNFKATGTGKTVIDGNGNIKSGGGDTIVDKDGNVSAVGLTIGGVSGISGSGTSGYIPEWTGTASLGNTTSPIFDNSGRIGIGTTNPLVDLQVRHDQAGITALYVSNGTNGIASQSFVSVTNANLDALNMGISPSGHTTGMGYDTPQTGFITATGAGGLALVSQSVTKSMKFWTAGLERMRIDQAGNVGIGTTSPATMLHMSSGTLTIDGNNGTPFQVNNSTFIITSGNVGIGTTSPAAPFVVNGGAQPGFTPTADLYTTSGNTFMVLRSVSPGQSGIILSTSTSLPFDTSIYAGILYKPSSPKMDIDMALPSGATPRIEFNGSGNPQIVLTADKNTGSAVNVTVSTDIVTFANGHTEYTGTAPALTSCGTGTSISGNDSIGVITTGALATACTFTFAQNWTNKPICRITDATTNATLAAQTAQSKSQITFTASAATSYNYDCKGYR